MRSTIISKNTDAYLIIKLNFHFYRDRLKPMTNILDSSANLILQSDFQNLIKSKVEFQCFMCMQEFDEDQYAPMIMCLNQHSCCVPCMAELLKKDSVKLLVCPQCHLPINKKAVTKNRLLLLIYQMIRVFRKNLSQIQKQAQQLRFNVKQKSEGSRTSGIFSKNPKMVSSVILPSEANESYIFELIPTFKSQIIPINFEKKKENLKKYAERQKIQELKNIVNNNIPFEQVFKLRSGYGCIKKIQCMQCFPNLKELYLYNNLIQQIQGLNVNLKLNVLSLANNKIEKVQNIGHLKELKRLSIEGNHIKKESAKFLSSFQWKNLETLNISFYCQQKQENDACLEILFETKSNQWSSLKSLFIYNSKQLTDQGKEIIKEFNKLRKMSSLQLYWK